MDLLKMDINQCPSEYYEIKHSSKIAIGAIGRHLITYPFRELSLNPNRISKCECIQGLEYPYIDIQEIGMKFFSNKIRGILV